jgi:hypothetical protein
MWTMSSPFRLVQHLSRCGFRQKPTGTESRFLRTELETSFTLASVAEAQQERGEPHAVQTLADAKTGYATLARFLSAPKHSKHITEQESMELSAGLFKERCLPRALGSDNGGPKVL